MQVAPSLIHQLFFFSLFLFQVNASETEGGWGLDVLPKIDLTPPFVPW